MGTKTTALILFFLSMTGFSCEEHNLEKETAVETFVPGEVMVGIKPDILTDQVFNLMNDKGASIDRMRGFYYSSLLPFDQLEFITNTLKAKPYIQIEGSTIKIDFSFNLITVVPSFTTMDINAQQDWVKTIAELELSMDVKPIFTKYVIIKVEPGTEQEWIEKFENHELVKFVTLNHIFRIG